MGAGVVYTDRYDPWMEDCVDWIHGTQDSPGSKMRAVYRSLVMMRMLDTVLILHAQVQEARWREQQNYIHLHLVR
jgi:hypothetical protein